MVKIGEQTTSALEEFIEKSHLKKGDILVIGCSSSEVCGGTIGKASSPEAAQVMVKSIMPLLKKKGILLAAQCCEHLNRALIVEKSTAEKIGAHEQVQRI